MKNDYFFTTRERMLLARHYKDIKENCYEAFRRLNKCDKDSIYNYSIQFNNPKNTRQNSKNFSYLKTNLLNSAISKRSSISLLAIILNIINDAAILQRSNCHMIV